MGLIVSNLLMAGVVRRRVAWWAAALLVVGAVTAQAQSDRPLAGGEVVPHSSQRKSTGRGALARPEKGNGLAFSLKK